GNDRPLVNAPAFYFLLGSATLELVGAGILGFVMTFALTNVWSHGTWVTSGHGHLALFGTFGMLGIGSAYWAVPAVRKFAHFDQKLGKLGFWLVFVGMLGIALSFAWGGTIQIYVYRILGLDWFGGDVFPAMGVFKLLLPTFGFLFLVGTLVIIYDLTSMGRREGDDKRTAADVVLEPAAAPVGWRRPLTGFEAGIWLLFMWIFGMLVTFGLLSFNLDRVRIDADPTLPYLLSGVGNLGLLLVTLGFVWRFTASLTSRIHAARAPLPEPDLSVH
ncbi:MAG TPA: cbb3-type cytochrome c oxidase subunit I, partial [Chiayiivirga sp.]|nr:cbb3-type cytochrome c oxidase subunit I [Chiayiivirga sp.]